MTGSRIFVDTWFWIASTVRDDSAHEQAAELGRQIPRRGCRLVTTNFVVAEALTRLRYDASLAAALALLARIERLAPTSLEVVTIDEPLWEAAVTWFSRFADQRFSFVDCTSFAVMAERGITDALTADRHFTVAGFKPLGAA